MNDIEKLIYGREAINEYVNNIKIKGVKAEKDIKKLNQALENIGMDKTTFTLFNMQQNFREIDRCFRFRKIDNPNEVALCDNCEGRCKTQCHNPLPEHRFEYFGGCMNDYNTYYQNFDYLVPNSLIMKEQMDKCSELGIDPKTIHILRPTSLILTHDFGFTWPNFCVGYGHQIEEPRFDIFWKMDEIIKFGHKIYSFMVDSKI